MLKEMKNLLNKKISQAGKEEINSAITYFTNHLEQMDYSTCLSKKLPIGSGVIDVSSLIDIFFGSLKSIAYTCTKILRVCL